HHYLASSAESACTGSSGHSGSYQQSSQYNSILTPLRSAATVSSGTVGSSRSSVHQRPLERHAHPSFAAAPGPPPAAADGSIFKFMPSSAATGRQSSSQSRQSQQRRTMPLTDPARCMAISEGRGTKSRDLAIAVLDLDSDRLDIVKLTDCLAYQKTLSLVCWFDPAIVLLPDTLCNSEIYELFRLLAVKFPACRIVSAPRILFNEADGRAFVRRVCHPDSQPVLQQLPVCNFIFYSCAVLQAFAELQLDTVFGDASVRLAYNAHSASLIMDYGTARQLELVESLDGRSGGHLFAVLNYTLTGGGARLLRMSLLQPLTDLDSIRTRQDCVEELRTNPAVLQSLRAQLAEFSYFNCINSLCRRRSRMPPTINVARTRINRIIYLHHMLGRLDPLSQALAPLRHPLFANFRRALDEPALPRLRAHFEVLANPDMRYSRGRLTMHAQRIGAVRPGVNDSLDRARQLYASQVAAAERLVADLAGRLGLEAALAHSKLRGFHAQCSRQALGRFLTERRKQIDGDANDDETLSSLLVSPHDSHNSSGAAAAAVSNSSASSAGNGNTYGSSSSWCSSELDCQAPQQRRREQRRPPTLLETASRLAPELLNLTIGRRCCSFTTSQLAALNADIEVSVENVYKLTLQIFELLFESLPAHAMQLFKCIDAVSNADLLSSLALASVQRGYTRPEFGDRLAIRCGRHPLPPPLACPTRRRSACGGGPGRHAFASRACSLLAVCGGAGQDRRDFLRQIGLMQVMAQAGSDVPALQASFRLCDRLIALRLAPIDEAPDSAGGAAESADWNTEGSGALFDQLSGLCNGLTSRSLVIVDVGNQMDLLSAAIRKLASATADAWCSRGRGAFAFIGCDSWPNRRSRAAVRGLGVLEFGEAKRA
ncbi:hypothetical protein BOX15_Mlig032607g1, partial [Macrostomum lignano]